MSEKPDIQIIDVIKHKSLYGEQIMVVIDRMPEFVYSAGDFEKVAGWGGRGRHLIARDSGFYDFMKEVPSSTDAFAGRKFTIQLDDGSDLECCGQVWNAAHPNPPEQTVDIGIGTIEKLHKCYVFSGGRISKSKLDAWLATNTPSRNYRKYDPSHTIEGLDKRWSGYSDRKVSPARARKLRKRGVTIRRNEGAISWSPWYERQKAQILADIAKDAAP